MGSGNKFLVFGSVIICAFVLQAVLAITDKSDTPGKAAVEFTKAYFKLDVSMADLLCNELTEEAEIDVVDQYLQRVADEARTLGFELNYMKNAISHIETETHMQDENTAQVRIRCDRSRFINPLYAVIAKLFFLTETHEVVETITMVKEDGRWKVCGRPFSLVEI